MGILTVGHSLLSFKSSYNYITAIADAMEGMYVFLIQDIIIFTIYLAHQCALLWAKILHCDVSIGNIIIDKNGHGLLIDWDLCA
jgi:RIO-like serine/threonine protein kinase